MTVSKVLLPKAKVNQPKNNRMSYEEFLAWADEDTLAEWVDGEVIPFMPVKIKHQRISNRLFHLIEQFIKLFKLGEVWSAPNGNAAPLRSIYPPARYFLCASSELTSSERRLA
ncbi:MAG: hypothetical protein V9G20_09185 [Candidatus Promineifilaceae bacterium]